MIRNPFWFIIGILFLILLLTACVPPTETPIPPTGTSAPLATTAAPPTLTAKPTTPVPATLTSIPTNTRKPDLLPTPSHTPAPDLTSALKDGLLAYWSLEGLSNGGVWLDVTAHGYHLTPAQNPAPVLGKIGNAVGLVSAQKQFLEQANSPLMVNTDFSWAGWVYPTSNTDNYILSKYQAGKGALLSIREGRIRFWAYGTGSEDKLESKIVNTDEWLFVCARYNSVGRQLYLQVDLEDTTQALSFAIEDPGKQVAMGVNSGWGDGFWDGAIDEFGWWNRTLDAEDCLDLYNAGVGRTPSSTVGPILTATSIPTITQTPYVCPDAPAVSLEIEEWVMVSVDPPVANRVRSEPGLSSEVLGQVEPGEVVQVLDGPRCVDGYNWWRVRSLEGLEGWSAEGDAEGYWFIHLDDVFLYNTVRQLATSRVNLQQGHTYRIILAGTYSIWFPDQWTVYGVCWGEDEPQPMFPSPNKANGHVGADPYRFFALPIYSGNCENGKLLSESATISKIMLSLDGGGSWNIPTPLTAEVREDHMYTYEVTGKGFPLKVRLDDAPLDDNYGQILVIIQEIE